MLILLILLSDLIGIVTIIYGFVIFVRGKVNLGLSRNLTGTKAYWAAGVCMIVGFALIRFNHAMVDAFPEGLGH
jgi:hypothetical protein